MTVDEKLKMLDLQYKGLTVPQVAAQLGVSEKTIRRQAARIGCPFSSHPPKNYPCISCRTPETATYHERICARCRSHQNERGVSYIETYEVFA